MSKLVPCSACRRHARVAETACPFCGAALADVPGTPFVAQGTKRAVIFAIGLGVAATSCDAFQPNDRESEPESEPTSLAVYGATVAPDDSDWGDAESASDPADLETATPGETATSLTTGAPASEDLVDAGSAAGIVEAGLVEAGPGREPDDAGLDAAIGIDAGDVAAGGAPNVASGGPSGAGGASSGAGGAPSVPETAVPPYGAPPNLN